MVSQVFYRKWRPQTLNDLAGQEHVAQTLRNALSSGHISHAYLFCGPRGTGKTSTGRILAKAVNCLTNEGKSEPCNTCSICVQITEGRCLDVIEIDAASNRGIDEIRKLREKVGYSPNEARHKVYIIDEVHGLTPDASNALLKTLEEPPPYAIFILATTEAHKVLPTILSRCQRFDFHRISQNDVFTKLDSICKSESIKIEPDALRLVARVAGGSLRDAENILEQLTVYYGADIGLKQAQATLGITGDWRARELIKNLMDNDIVKGIATINSAQNDGLDLNQFSREVVAYLRALLLLKTGSSQGVDMPAEELAELKQVAAKATLPQIVKATRLFSQLEPGIDNYATLPLELALVECAMAPPEPKTTSVSKPVTAAAKPAIEAAPVIKPAAKPVIKPEPIVVPPEKVAEARVGKPPEAVKPVPAADNQPTEKAAPVAAKKTKSAEDNRLVGQAKPAMEIDSLRQNWKQLVIPENLSRSQAASLLKFSAFPKSIEGDIIVLNLKYPSHKENLEKPVNLQAAEKILTSYLGRACRIRCVCEQSNHLVKRALEIGGEITDSEDK